MIQKSNTSVVFGDIFVAVSPLLDSPSLPSVHRIELELGLELICLEVGHDSGFVNNSTNVKASLWEWLAAQSSRG